MKTRFHATHSPPADVPEITAGCPRTVARVLTKSTATENAIGTVGVKA